MFFYLRFHEVLEDQSSDVPSTQLYEVAVEPMDKWQINGILHNRGKRIWSQISSYKSIYVNIIRLIQNWVS